MPSEIAGLGPLYLDWAATAPLCEEAVEAMSPLIVSGVPGLAAGGGNANSLHSPGRAAFSLLESARSHVACSIGAHRPDEVVFTSGATEADNAALEGLMEASLRRSREKRGGGEAPHLITTAIEHDAVLACARRLRARGCEVTFLPSSRDGFIEPDALRAALRPETALVSVMMANNEVGSIQPIGELAHIAHEGGALFHTDAVQAFGKVPLDVTALDVDAASFSAHKVCGPKGIGALYLKARTPFAALILGGGQEAGKRSGTQNVCGAVGFAAACDAAVDRIALEGPRLTALRDNLYARLSAIPGVRRSVPVEVGDVRYLPSIVNVMVDGYESETLILRLDRAGIAVSGGSACASHSLEPSHVLTALGIARDDALHSLRVSMGRYTETSDIDRFVVAFREAVRA